MDCFCHPVRTIARGPHTRGATEINTVQNCSTVRETIVETSEAPKCTVITTEDFIKCQRAHEIYKRRVAETNNRDDIEVPLTS